MSFDDLRILAALTGVSCLAVFLILAILRIIPAVRRSVILRRITVICGLTWLILLAVLFSISWLIEESNAVIRLRAIPTVALAALAIALFAWGRYAWRLRREPLRGPNCPHCRYDLTGINPLTTCPECGHALTNPKKLYLPNIRRWATRSAVLVLTLAIAWPAYDIIRKDGWPALLPDRALFQLLAWNIQPQPVLLEIYRRHATLEAYPTQTRALMRSFADEYESGRSNVRRLYPLYEGSNDEETNTLLVAWLTSPRKGERFVAVFMLSGNTYHSEVFSVDRLRALLNDPDAGIRTIALRVLIHAQAIPLDELLALIANPSSGIAPTEFSIALRAFESDPRAIDALYAIASNPNNGWADFTTWQLLCENSSDLKTLARLANQKAAFPTPRNVPGYNPSNTAYFNGIFTPILTAALNPADPTTAAWCRGCLLSLATPGPSLTPPRPIILKLIDDQLATTKDPATRTTLTTLRTTIDPTTPQSP